MVLMLSNSKAKVNSAAPRPPSGLWGRSFSERSRIRLLAWLLRYPTRRVPRILVYHRFGENSRSITPQGFEQQLRFLRQHCTVIHLTRLVAALRGIEPMPRNAVVVTVDDGYADFYNVAFPLICRYEIPCTFFVTTNFIGGGKWLWPDKLAWLLVQRSEFPDLRVASSVINGGVRSATRLWVEILAILRKTEFTDLEGALHQLARQLEVEVPERPVAGYEACTWDQLRLMEASGFVEIGGHTRNHAILSRVDGRQLADEIDGCLEDLNANLGTRARAFCYPNGKPADYNDIVREAVVKAGFLCACTAFYDDRHLNDQYALRRFSSSKDFAQFYKAASGLQYWGASLLGRNNIDDME